MRLIKKLLYICRTKFKCNKMKNLNEKELALLFWCALTVIFCGAIVLLAIIVTSK